MGLGNGDNGQFTFLDMISITSFLIGLMNLDENISQGDLQDKAELILNEIHAHLKEQDKLLKEIRDGIRKDI